MQVSANPLAYTVVHVCNLHNVNTCARYTKSDWSMSMMRNNGDANVSVSTSCY